MALYVYMSKPVVMVGHKAKNPVQTSKMTFRVIEGIETLQGATLSELTAYLNEPKSTVHNHLSTLLEEGYIIKQNDKYRLGLRFAELGEQSKASYDIYTIGAGEVDDLAEKTDELCNLATEEHGRVVYLRRSEGTNAISTDTFSGKRVPLHCTALGKAMLAFMPTERVETIVDHFGLPAATEHTITCRDELYEELNRIRADNVAFDDEERAPGIRCVAAPIRCHQTKDAIGAVSVSAPINRMSGSRYKDEITELLNQTVNVIEIELSYSNRQ